MEHGVDSALIKETAACYFIIYYIGGYLASIQYLILKSMSADIDNVLEITCIPKTNREYCQYYMTAFVSAGKR